MKVSEIQAGDYYEGGSRSRLRWLHGVVRFVISVEANADDPRYGLVTFRQILPAVAGTSTVTCYACVFARWADRRLPEPPAEV